MRRLWTIYFRVLAIVGVLALGTSAVVWLHATLGYAQHGILEGADLRSDMIQILWLCIAAGTLVSSGVLALAARITRRWPVLVIAYVVGLASVPVIFPLIDRYY